MRPFTGPLEPLEQPLDGLAVFLEQHDRIHGDTFSPDYRLSSRTGAALNQLAPCRTAETSDRVGFRGLGITLRKLGTNITGDAVVATLEDGMGCRMEGRRVPVGAAAGAAATVVMTGWMLTGQAISRHGELAPKRLVRRTAQLGGLPARRLSRATLATTAIAHLGFGAACGALYTLVVRRSSVPRGIALGSAVWVTSYAGWIPALRLLPPPHRDKAGRAWTTMTAHIVYGAALGAAVRVYDDNTKPKQAPAKRNPPQSPRHNGFPASTKRAPTNSQPPSDNT
jgi:hypothetical protein